MLPGQSKYPAGGDDRIILPGNRHFWRTGAEQRSSAQGRAVTCAVPVANFRLSCNLLPGWVRSRLLRHRRPHFKQVGGILSFSRALRPPA